MAYGHKRLKQNKSLLPINSRLFSLSGGQDSMALLKLIMDLKGYINGKSIWHGDHQWHTKSRNRRRTQNLVLNKTNIISLNKANREEVANEEKARDWRYKNL